MLVLPIVPFRSFEDCLDPHVSFHSVPEIRVLYSSVTLPLVISIQFRPFHRDRSTSFFFILVILSVSSDLTHLWQYIHVDLLQRKQNTGNLYFFKSCYSLIQSLFFLSLLFIKKKKLLYSCYVHLLFPIS